MAKTGLVLQAGGNGTRFMDTDIPKPIYPLSDEGETCLSNILGSVRYGTPVFLHIQPRQGNKYRAAMFRINSKGDIYHLFQEDDFVYNTKGEAAVENGEPLRANNGPASFRKNLGEIVECSRIGLEFFAVYDACKTGICFDDITEGVERLAAEGKGVLCYTRQMTPEMLKEEEARAETRTIRYDRAINGGVYDKRHMPFDITANPEAAALTGLNIFRYDRFMANTAGMRGMTGYYPKKHPELLHIYDFRITDIISRFSIGDRIFLEQPEEHYFMSIKFPEDLEKYRNQKTERRKTK